MSATGCTFDPETLMLALESANEALRAATEEESRAWSVLTGQAWTQTRPEGSLLAAAERVVADLAAARAQVEAMRETVRSYLDDVWRGDGATLGPVEPYEKPFDAMQRLTNAQIASLRAVVSATRAPVAAIQNRATGEVEPIPPEHAPTFTPSQVAAPPSAVEVLRECVDRHEDDDGREVYEGEWAPMLTRLDARRDAAKRGGR